jgi:ferrochelatase
MTEAPNPRGILLLNLGTPDGDHPGPSVPQVRRYLREFLMDPLVVDIPALARWLLVHAIILPRRPARSAEAYHKVWLKRGSPLLVHLQDLVAKVAERAGPGVRVVGGMRYGNPSIRHALVQLQQAGVKETLVIPLYPQYSLAATESSVIACRELVRQVAPGMKLVFKPAFYQEPAFLDAFAAVARRALEGFAHDHVLFSFHGLPERQIRKIDESGSTCLASENCCAEITNANRNCYRAQCFQTARDLAARLGIPADRYSVGFQSRLGVTAWIKPYTDLLYGELIERGRRRVAVLCPAFVADCLETLEEVAIRGNEQFRELGGEELKLVPSLNSEPEWVEAVTGWVRQSGA